MIVDLLFVITLAVAVGAVVGLVPGLTPLIGLMLVMPVIAHFSVPEIITFWVCFLSVSQYYGSVGALLLKVPGETSSLPVLVNSRDLKLSKSVLQVYRLTAYSSYIASVVGISLFVLILYLLHDSWYVLFSLKFTVAFVLTILVLLLITKRQYLLNTLFIIAGLTLSYLPESTSAVSWCAANNWSCFALNPVDFNLVIVSLYVVPYLLTSTNYFAQRKASSTTGSWASIVKFKWLAVKHALIGFIVGFTPGMGVTLSSNLSASLEERKNPHKKMSAMAAAEAANNSSAISCSIPFLFIGLPITGTELFLDNWLRVFKAFDINYELLYQNLQFASFTVPFYYVLPAALLLVCSVCFVLTSRFIKLYQQLTAIPPQAFDFAIKSTIVGITAYSLMVAVEAGWIIPLATLLIFSTIGIVAHRRNINIIALPVTIVIGKFAIDKLLTAYNLWF